MSNEFVAVADQGRTGQPGDRACKIFAGVRQRGDQWELQATYARGSNQGGPEPNWEHSTTRAYRGDNLDELLRISLSEVKEDSAFSDVVSDMRESVRQAIFDAKAIEDDKPAPPEMVALTDGSGKWFDRAAADEIEEGSYHDGSNMISMATGSQWSHERLYRTKNGAWVLHAWSVQDRSVDRYTLIGNEDAAKWLARNELVHPDAMEDIASLEI